ncbi:uncharacterized protein LOC107762231 [Nicotiana tabacum]|uniref:Uncharacterized protein n=3 Tax=Nicotiana TaxID=4085 RepID=A0A1S3X843_TOBAC|nr:PREDICTED: uncharacterized protein LOC104225218 [Nicotiana sylvestris]XP_009775285.1 PREDICTED: uncharacterized protein LOC104225218 [Nicotiana sylvestris]XP_009775286.1 PREDICTED: uncharacterized protein LOC104225218 [Nicotiana sylvestris]XP_016436061.1 PREDICTED: uncharacterized protein LOC107762231 [Nicotiana tabacum]XP_016436062.1 PREDICTED: uncharacterized protein LOC107762231 [Nicotiana tabacum]XP_016436063.1 PREDICTED: uncharacterized protein LOC107762231 [Nicotiana tabacum]
MTPPSISVIPSSSTTIVSPKPLKPPPVVQPQLPSLETKLFSRRNAVVWLSLIAPLTYPASALSFGISGPKEWLRDQKKKTAKYLLAPIDASRNILGSAYLLLTRTESDFGEKELEEVQSLLRSAARDCVPQERNSFVQFQSNTGVEVCTFRLVVKNASSLLADKDPVKLAAETKLIDLIRSFASLSDMANEIDVQVASNRQKVANALMDTVTCLDKLEQGVKECLEV